LAFGAMLHGFVAYPRSQSIDGRLVQVVVSPAEPSGASQATARRYTESSLDSVAHQRPSSNKPSAYYGPDTSIHRQRSRVCRPKLAGASIANSHEVREVKQDNNE
jgi:hypothetical protein